MNRLVEFFLCAVLFSTLGIPALAVAADAFGVGDGEGPVIGGLFSQPPDEPSRPLGLATESLKLVVLCGFAAVPLGVFMAVLLFRTDVPFRRGILGLIAISALIPLPLLVTAWLGSFGNIGRSQAFGESPLLSGVLGAAFVHAAAALPWVVCLTGVGLVGSERELEESALLDFSPFQVLRSVTLRSSLGAVAGACLFIAVQTASDMTVTDLLQVRVYAEEAYLQAQLGGPSAAFATSLPPTILLIILIVIGAKSLNSRDPARLASVGRNTHAWPLGRARLPLGMLVVSFVIALLGPPLYGLVWRAGRVGGVAAVGLAPHWSLGGLLGTLRLSLRDMVGPLSVSLVVSAVSASFTTVFAWLLAWKSRDSCLWKVVAVAATAISLATPGPVVGMALAYGYSRFPWIYGSPAMIVLAHLIRTFPYVLLILWPAIRAIPSEYLETAEIEGLDLAGKLREVALPATRGAIVAGWFAAFILAFGELPATHLVSPPGINTLTTHFWSRLHTGVESGLAGNALVSIGVVAGLGLIGLALSRAVRK